MVFCFQNGFIVFKNGFIVFKNGSMVLKMLILNSNKTKVSSKISIKAEWLYFQFEMCFIMVLQIPIKRGEGGQPQQFLFRATSKSSSFQYCFLMSNACRCKMGRTRIFRWLGREIAVVCLPSHCTSLPELKLSTLCAKIHCTYCFKPFVKPVFVIF